VQPVDGIDRWTRCRTIEICRSARIDNLNLRQYMHRHIRIDTESNLYPLLPKLIRGLANLQRESGHLEAVDGVLFREYSRPSIENHTVLGTNQLILFKNTYKSY